MLKIFKFTHTLTNLCSHEKPNASVIHSPSISIGMNADFNPLDFPGLDGVDLIAEPESIMNEPTFQFNQNNSNPQPRQINAPGENDCLIGRGGGTNNHPGNKKYRELISKYKPMYHAASRTDKPVIANQVLQVWKNQSPPGRFLKQDQIGLFWFEVDDGKARSKTSQSLRELGKDEKQRRRNASNVAAAAQIQTVTRELAKADVAREVDSELRNLGISVASKECSLLEAGLANLDHTTVPALINRIRNIFGIEFSLEIANMSINTITASIYTSLTASIKNARRPPLAPVVAKSTTIGDILAAAQAVKTPPKSKVQIQQPVVKDDDSKPAAQPIHQPNTQLNKWRPEEDTQLRHQVADKGSRWSEIAECIENRNASQCRDRWIHHLAPGLKKGGWTAEEDERIKALHAKYGNSWSKIASGIQGRSDNSIKNRWNSWLRAQKAQQESVSSQDEIASITLLQMRESPLTLPDEEAFGLQVPQTIVTSQVQEKSESLSEAPSVKKRKVSDHSIEGKYSTNDEGSYRLVLVYVRNKCRFINTLLCTLSLL